MTVRDVMTREFVGVSESDTVLGAVKLMHEEDAGYVVVLRGSEPVGIVTESDVLALVADERDPADVAVSSVMSDPVVSVDVDRALSDAAATMSREDIRRLAATSDGELAGVLSERDVIAASASLSSVPTIREVPGDGVVGRSEAGETQMGTEAASSSGESDRYEYADRSICETCGSLSRGLANVNGQLICADCRDV